MVNPLTVEVGQGNNHISLNSGRDYVLVLPTGGLTGTLWINGGHNVSLIGGKVTVPSTANQTDNGRDDTDTAIYVKGATGIVHIEGVLIEGESDVMFDGIDINAPLATVQIENVRIAGVAGSYSSEHGDVVQTWGGVKDLRIDRLSADSDYQGLTIDPDLGPMGSAQIDDVDLTVDATPPALVATTVGGGHMIWLTSGSTTCNSFPVSLSNVYVSSKRPGLPLPATVWPQAERTTLSCAGDLIGNQVSYPNLPVTGDITLGSPPAGEYVPPGVAGTSYSTPGYGDEVPTSEPTQGPDPIAGSGPSEVPIPGEGPSPTTEESQAELPGTGTLETGVLIPAAIASPEPAGSAQATKPVTAAGVTSPRSPGACPPAAPPSCTHTLRSGVTRLRTQHRRKRAKRSKLRREHRGRVKSSKERTGKKRQRQR
jgi:hypothetical protein